MFKNVKIIDWVLKTIPQIGQIVLKISKTFAQIYKTSKFRHFLKIYLLRHWIKPLHTIGKVSVNASILYKNQEICNKINLWKFQRISLFLLRENIKNAFSIFVFILMAGVFVSRDENSLLDLFHQLFKNDNTSGRNISREAFYHRYLYTM